MRPDGSVLWLLGRASLRAHHLMNERFAAVGLRKLHYITMKAIERATQTVTQAQLCRYTSIDRSDMVALLNDLEREGYVRRAPDPANRRRNIVTLTGPGHTMLEKLDAIAAEARDVILGSLSAPERAQFTEYLERIVNDQDCR